MSVTVTSPLILVNTKPPVLKAKSTSLGNAEVLSRILPGLAFERKAKPWEKLKQVDYYMLEETNEMCQRIKRYCHQGEDISAKNFKIRLKGNRLVIDQSSSKFKTIETKLNQDKWLLGAFTWLAPNYIALAHSIELLNFSRIYQDSIDCALRTFGHFDACDNGLEFSLLYQSGNVRGIVESPISIYAV